MDDVSYFWTGWEPLLRIVVVGTLTYLAIVIMLRVSGKRSLASMNAYDFIITIAMGAVFGANLTGKNVSVSESVMAFLLLLFLNYLFSFLESRSGFFKDLVTSQPSLLFYNGRYLDKTMKNQRLRKRDIIGAARKKQIKDMAEVEAIILETDGTFSVIKKSGDLKNTTYNELLE